MCKIKDDESVLIRYIHRTTYLFTHQFLASGSITLWVLLNLSVNHTEDKLSQTNLDRIKDLEEVVLTVTRKLGYV